ncbi:hypothetical protein Tco_0049346 [Tanacetum coccineum]
MSSAVETLRGLAVLIEAPTLVIAAPAALTSSADLDQFHLSSSPIWKNLLHHLHHQRPQIFALLLDWIDLAALSNFFTFLISESWGMVGVLSMLPLPYLASKLETVVAAPPCLTSTLVDTASSAVGGDESGGCEVDVAPVGVCWDSTRTVDPSP